MPVASSIFPGLFYSSFKASEFILRNLVHFELRQSDKHGSSLSFLQEDALFSQQNLLEVVIFTSNVYDTLSNLGKYSCVNLYPLLLFCSTGIHICFCGSTLLFLMLGLCSIV
jgi:hypothetical protein